MKLFALAVFVSTMYFNVFVLDQPPISQIIAKDSLQADWKKHTEMVLSQIKGREDLRADSVFQNVETLGGMPAKRLLAVMKFGYSRSLGVGCGHCHNVNDWASDEKHQKQITRDMSAMVRRVN